MPVNRPAVMPNNRGERDSQHHKERVSRQIADHLKRNVGKEDIITGGGGKIRVPVKGQKQYRFILHRPKGGAPVGPGSSPTTALQRTMSRSTCIAPSDRGRVGGGE